MKYFLVVILTCCIASVFAQKRIIDRSCYKNWPSIGTSIQITDDGKFVTYVKSNQRSDVYTTVIEDINARWKTEITNFGTSEVRFSSSCKYAVFKKGNDSLAIQTLGSDIIRFVTDVSSYRLQNCNGIDWLCYSLVSDRNALRLQSMVTNKIISFENVKSYTFSETGKVLIIRNFKENDQSKECLNWIDMKNGKMYKIWEGPVINDIVVDQNHPQVAFRTGDSVWYYRHNFDRKAHLLVRDSIEIKNGLKIGSLDRFSMDGKRLFFTLNEEAKSKPINDAIEIWSYQDSRLQSDQQVELSVKQYICLFNLETHKVVRLQHNVYDQFNFPTKRIEGDTLALVNCGINSLEVWNIKARITWKLISLNDGHRINLDFLDGNNFVDISPTGKYLVYFDSSANGYFSYEIATKNIRNLTQNLNVSWIDLQKDDAPQPSPRGIYNMIWFDNDDSFFVYDKYDIWKIDPLGERKPFNLTNGYGNRHQIIFNFVIKKDAEQSIQDRKPFYLSAFNTTNKHNGFYLKEFNSQGDPVLLSMGAFVYNTFSGYLDQGANFSPIKAKRNNLYVVRRMSATEAPNYFSTRGFKKFSKLSDLKPEKMYNWYSTELHTWRSLDGRFLNGILYKPENFNPKKKYPVIFTIYERKSDGLNVYIKPDDLCGDCNINITSYVSQGYLVFAPDIYYKIGDPMQGTYDAVVSAATYVSSLSFIDEKKMGIQGCSFGGYQTNYLITHTNLFAAAITVSGITDLISDYGGAVSGRSGQMKFENGQIRMGASLWERPEAYIKNSSIFNLDKVNTPLLIVHTKKDEICSFANALELFSGLRRLGKKTWMVVYPNQNHGIYGADATDLSIRMLQYFDHYIKDKPAPVWMTRGINVRKRGVHDGYEYDNQIKTPGFGLVDSTKTMNSD